MLDDIGEALNKASANKLGSQAHIFAALDKSDKGVIYATVNNALLIFALDQRVNDCLGYNEFKSEPLLLKAPPPLNGASMPGPYPRGWLAEDVTFFHAFFQHEWCHKFTRDTMEAALLAAASQKRFHPVRDWLSTLRWDGSHRLNYWLRCAFGCPDDDYHAAIGAKFLIAAVRRVRQPGCKFDYMPVLEGNQGIGKSTAIRMLFGEQWFTDSLPAALENRDAAIGLVGVWVVEFAEIEQVIRAEVEVVKAFISRPVDRYRPVHGRGFIERPRQGVLIGTTNSADYLRDSTGNRRFWPIRCVKADVDWLDEHRAQIWAEAAEREAAGESIWLDNLNTATVAVKEQQERLEEDVWSERIRTFLSGKEEVAISDILSDCLSIPTHLQGKGHQMRVGKILTSARTTSGEQEWNRVTTRRGGNIKKLWIRFQGGSNEEVVARW